MEGAAHLVWIATGWKQQWYQLSKEEQSEIMAKCGEATQRFGGERLFTSKSLAGQPVFGAVRYPDLDSLEKSMAAHAEFDWPDKYIDVVQMAGIPYGQ